jgi:hypothetical protein
VPLEGPDEDERAAGRDVALRTVVETMVMVVGCPPDRVPVRVVTTPDVAADAKTEPVPGGEALIAVAGVLGVEGRTALLGIAAGGGLVTAPEELIAVAMGPPGILLAKLARPLENIGGPGLGGAPEEPLVACAGVLVKMAVPPPGTLLVSVTTMLELADCPGLPEGTGDTPPMNVAVTLVRVVVRPPGATLVMVITKLDISEGGPDRVPEEDIGGAGAPDDGSEAIVDVTATFVGPLGVIGVLGNAPVIDELAGIAAMLDGIGGEAVLWGVDCGGTAPTLVS